MAQKQAKQTALLHIAPGKLAIFLQPLCCQLHLTAQSRQALEQQQPLVLSSRMADVTELRRVAFQRQHYSFTQVVDEA